MIDDDFESVVRRMFESIFGSIGTFQEGSGFFNYFSDSAVKESDRLSELTDEKELDMERIDLEDQVLFLVTMDFDDSESSARVAENTLIVAYGPENKEIRADLDFDVDIEKSHVSKRNGVVEISLKKAKKDGSGLKNGYLKID
jgi:HSP20 family molecular chaperone IbpA